MRAVTRKSVYIRPITRVPGGGPISSMFVCCEWPWVCEVADRFETAGHKNLGAFCQATTRPSIRLKVPPEALLAHDKPISSLLAPSCGL